MVLSRCACGGVYALAVWSSLAYAQVAGADSPALQELVVIGSTPLPGTSIDVDKVPGNVQSLSAGDLKRDARLGSVNTNSTLGDPFQPDVYYRGFAICELWWLTF